jgi:integrase
MDRGVFILRAEAESTTLAEALDRYLREITLTRKPSTVAREKNRVAVLLGYPTANRSLASIKGSDISMFIRGQLPKLPGGRDRRLVDDKATRLLAAASMDPGNHISSLITWAIEIPMRRGEIAVMRWEHLDCTTRSGGNEGRVLLIRETKKGRPDGSRCPQQRWPHCHPRGVVLDALPRRLDGRVWGPDSISQASLWAERPIERVCQAAGIEGPTLHDLRHEATSRFFEQSFNLMEVAAITGHKTLSMLKRYTQLLRDPDVLENGGRKPLPPTEDTIVVRSSWLFWLVWLASLFLARIRLA